MNNTVKNSVFVIQVYRHPLIPTMWVFDDPKTGLVAEAFVLGASELIDIYLKKNNITDPKPAIIFSKTQLPKADIILTRTSLDKGRRSAWFEDEYGNKCWLCPAQLLYFNKVPKMIWAQIKSSQP